MNFCEISNKTTNRNEMINETKFETKRNYRNINNLLFCWTNEKTKRIDNKNIKTTRNSKTKIKTKIKVKTKTKNENEKRKRKTKTKMKNETKTKTKRKLKKRLWSNDSTSQKTIEKRKKRMMNIEYSLTFWKTKTSETKTKRTKKQNENWIECFLLKRREIELNAFYWNDERLSWILLSIEAKKKLDWMFFIETTRTELRVFCWSDQTNRLDFQFMKASRICVDLS